jgi:hypothetical protein
LEVKSFHKKQEFLHREVTKVTTLAPPALRSMQCSAAGSAREKHLKTFAFFAPLQNLTVKANRQLRIEQKWLSELESYLYDRVFPTNFVY